MLTVCMYTYCLTYYYCYMRCKQCLTCQSIFPLTRRDLWFPKSAWRFGFKARITRIGPRNCHLGSKTRDERNRLLACLKGINDHCTHSDCLYNRVLYLCSYTSVLYHLLDLPHSHHGFKISSIIRSHSFYQYTLIHICLHL